MKEIALHILDITQNSVRAGADEINITVSESEVQNLLTMEITDNGAGMDDKTLSQALSAWFTTRTTRRVGMGLPLLKMNAEMAGGELSLTSVKGKGTDVRATFGLNHIDRPPLGDIEGVVALLITSYPGINITYCHRSEGHSWAISTREIMDVLESHDISDPATIRGLTSIIRNNINSIRNITLIHDKN